MTNEMISKLEAIGFNRWQKGSMDRLYVNAGALGLRCDYYKTGSIHHAEFNGRDISNCEARRMKAAKTYIDVATGEVRGDHSDLVNRVNEILATM